MPARKVRRFDSIVVHHSATKRGSYQTIRAQHRRNRKWSEAAYHMLLSNGTMGVRAGTLQTTSHFGRNTLAGSTRSLTCNLTGLHICLIGNYEEGPVPDSLKPAIGHALALLQEKFDIADDAVLFHGLDCSPTLCPGKFLTKTDLLTWKKLAAACPPAVREQQRRALGMGDEPPQSAKAD